MQTHNLFSEVRAVPCDARRVVPETVVGHDGAIVPPRVVDDVTVVVILPAVAIKIVSVTVVFDSAGCFMSRVHRHFGYDATIVENHFEDHGAPEAIKTRNPLPGRVS
jgi:hypothetical protein